MKPNGAFFLLFTYLILLSCTTTMKHEECFVPVSTADSIQTVLFLSDAKELNMFYDLCADDSSLYCLDFYNDTILKTYPQTTVPAISRYATKGQGPDDIILPFFTREIASKGKNIRMTDVNAWSLREIVDGSSPRIHLNSTRLPIIPTMQDYAENDDYIYGTNIDDPESLFFIYDKREQKLKSIYYYDENLVKDKYPGSFLLTGNLLLHPERGICRSMNNLNSLLFYDLQGNLRKEAVIGKERTWPEPDPQFLDFPKANKYAISITGNQERIYVLYNGYPMEAKGEYSKILIFDWDGNFLKSVQTDRNLSKIATTPSENYLYAIADNEEGGTDIIRIVL